MVNSQMMRKGASGFSSILCRSNLSTAAAISESKLALLDRPVTSSSRCTRALFETTNTSLLVAGVGWQLSL